MIALDRVALYMMALQLRIMLHNSGLTLSECNVLLYDPGIELLN